MQQPPGFSTDSTLVCRLNNAKYGLKQAPHAWFQKLSTTLLHLGFVAAKSDTSLFTRFTQSHTIFILIYVDDILVTGSSLVLVQDFSKQLGLYFALKNLGPLHYFLGIEVSWLKNDSIHLSQAKYIKDLLGCTNMVNSRPQPSPMLSSLRLTTDESVSVDDPTLYQSIVSTLQYATITRLEISFSINRVCQYMHKPQIHHWKIVKRILRYLADTPTHGLLLTPSPAYSITGFSDSD